MSPSVPTPEELHARLSAVERTAGDSLVEIRHNQTSQSQLIQQLQQDMHKLVSLSETQILLQERQQEYSKAVERSFAAIKENRTEILRIIESNDQRWAAWRDNHERENLDTASFATSARGGLRVLAVLGVTLWALLGWLALDWRNDLQLAIGREEQAREKFDNAADLRLDANSSAIQENRIHLNEIKMDHQLE
jgi:hypothetical protein